MLFILKDKSLIFNIYIVTLGLITKKYSRHFVNDVCFGNKRKGTYIHMATQYHNLYLNLISISNYLEGKYTGIIQQLTEKKIPKGH